MYKTRIRHGEESFGVGPLDVSVAVDPYQAHYAGCKLIFNNLQCKH